MQKLFTIIFLLMAGLCMTVTAIMGQTKPEDLNVWFDKPAANWNEALPIGNGHLGAMIFGEVQQERLQLNEETIWRGKDVDFVNPESKKALPEIRKLLFEGRYVEATNKAEEKMMGNKEVYSTYQMLGNLFITLHDTMQHVNNYYRDIDLKTAISKVSYTGDGVDYERKMFVSNPDKVMVVHLTASEKETLNFDIELKRPSDRVKFKTEGDELLMHEQLIDDEGMKYCARLCTKNTDGTVTINNNVVTVKGASEVMLLLSAASDYWGGDPSIISAQQLAEAKTKSYQELSETHIADYQQYFNRVELDLGANGARFYPVDARVAAISRGMSDPHLVKLYYQFGRYLLISSSRPGGLPANLQGIWADGMNPPWSADYHININIQMNYWPAEITNLPEMHLPFLEFMKALLPDGRKTARDMYGIDGAVCHFTTDPWHFTEPYGKPEWAMWPMGLAWCAQHHWEHYLFTEDKQYLDALAYPVMRDAAEFCVNFLVENPKTGKLVSGPSISPENTFRTKEGGRATLVMGPTMDHMIIRDLLTASIEASEILGKDTKFRKKMKKTLEQLAPTQISSDGRIMEWTEEFEEDQPGHRHISHLFGLYPGREITQQHQPELMEAAKKTIDYRLSHGGGHTGWSRAWIINFFARLQNSEEAYNNLIALFAKSTLPNLFDNHPPFQIDGNFGATAGITEMLLQSHAGEVHLLPALPSAWPKGSISGICARGGFEISMQWVNNKLVSATLLSTLGNDCQVRYGEKTIDFSTEKGETYNLLEKLGL